MDQLRNFIHEMQKNKTDIEFFFPISAFKLSHPLDRKTSLFWFSLLDVCSAALQLGFVFESALPILAALLFVPFDRFHDRYVIYMKFFLFPSPLAISPILIVFISLFIWLRYRFYPFITALYKSPFLRFVLRYFNDPLRAFCFGTMVPWPLLSFIR